MKENGPYKCANELASLSEKEIKRHVKTLADKDIIDLLDCRFRNVVDVAAGELHERGAVQLVAEALLSRKLKTTLGKVAAFNICFSYGRRCPKVKDICLQYLYDTSNTIVAEALFGLVFLGDKDAIPVLRDAVKRSTSVDDEKRQAILSAIKALESANPFLYKYARYVVFKGNPWGLDVDKYPDRFLLGK